jgi:hypothetical protein
MQPEFPNIRTNSNAWPELSKRLAMVLRQRENLMLLVNALDEISGSSGFGAVTLQISKGKIVMIQTTINRKTI